MPRKTRTVADDARVQRVASMRPRPDAAENHQVIYDDLAGFLMLQ